VVTLKVAEESRIGIIAQKLAGEFAGEHYAIGDRRRGAA
jgi:hypothetical protein